jgi:hypothetical protein
MDPQDGQAGGAELAAAEPDRVGAHRRQRRLTRSCRLAALEAVDVPEQVVSVLDALEDLAPPPRPRDGLLIVGVQGRSELLQVLVDLGPLPKIERRPPNVVDRWQCLHGSSSGSGCVRRRPRRRHSRCSSGESCRRAATGFAQRLPRCDRCARTQPPSRHAPRREPPTAPPATHRAASHPPRRQPPPSPRHRPPSPRHRHAESARTRIRAESISNRCGCGYVHVPRGEDVGGGQGGGTRTGTGTGTGVTVATGRSGQVVAERRRPATGHPRG